MDTGDRTRCSKSGSKKVAHKTAEAARELMGIEANSRIVEEIVIPSEKRQEALNELTQVL